MRRLTEILEQLVQLGYSHDFKFLDNGVECLNTNRVHEDGYCVRLYDTVPLINAAVLLVETDDGVKGTVIDYSDH